MKLKFMLATAIVLFVSCIIIQYRYTRMKFEGFSSTLPGSCAIAVLTKGYASNEEYKELVARNQSIYDKLYIYHPDLYDIIIFHEGNITPEQQTYIQNATPMPLRFISITFRTDVINNDRCPPTNLSNRFSMGYKNMCHFWSIGFFKHLDKYDYIIRIDEDCILQIIDPDIINNYKNKGIRYASPYFQGNDDPDVVVGMEYFFKSYLSNHKLVPKRDEIRCPYTNVFIMDMTYFKNNAQLKDLLRELEATNCIWSNRWGDLPIWGYILSYLFDDNIYKEDKTIRYIHGSHGSTIN